MLVLARRLGETIVIGGDIHITVVGTKGECIRLGIDEPRNVLVDRKEVHERRMQFTAPLAAPAPLLGAGSTSVVIERGLRRRRAATRSLPCGI